MQHRLLAILAHPDDESLGMGATLAKYAAEGVDVHLVCATRGERGWCGVPPENPGPAGMGIIREGELRAAARELGIASLSFLDAIDAELAQTPSALMHARLTEQIRAIQPDVVVTFGPEGDYGHPDHIAICQLAAGALVCAADPTYHPGGPVRLPGTAPHRVSKFYYIVNSPQLDDLFQRYQIGSSIEVDGVLRQETHWPEWAITTRIAGLQLHWPRAKRAILCHRSQLPSLGDIESMPDEIWQEILCAQDAFFRVYSTARHTPGLEDDFFAGLR